MPGSMQTKDIITKTVTIFKISMKTGRKTVTSDRLRVSNAMARVGT